MIAFLIGLSSSLLTILLFTIFKKFDKRTVYGLILMGIGFLYIGYTWTDLPTAALSGAQALFFMTLAYLGIMRSYWFLIAGYIMHGLWDFLYPVFANPDLLPPDYDYFCFTYDVVVGLYLLFYYFKRVRISSKAAIVLPGKDEVHYKLT
ncbi:MAG TPA: DUF6010 family protein [Flavobacterium sp.]|nr:DUF6010 family protein [Flavobacterium sp.]